MIFERAASLRNITRHARLQRLYGGDKETQMTQKIRRCIQSCNLMFNAEVMIFRMGRRQVVASMWILRINASVVRNTAKKRHFQICTGVFKRLGNISKAGCVQAPIDGRERSRFRRR